ncbi:hypothetical protein PLESTB_001002300 [Pleodorina starrii]|uniref:Uncharacterized protein n=1 Tax=Pleodorina starrii TaxID=330485 RepID=A0A9W6BNV9_9CHLO|nr:hypothetical protein PLESTB_001002300 [Pleodorina starrii]
MIEPTRPILLRIIVSQQQRDHHKGQRNVFEGSRRKYGHEHTSAMTLREVLVDMDARNIPRERLPLQIEVWDDPDVKNEYDSKPPSEAGGNPPKRRRTTGDAAVAVEAAAAAFSPGRCLARTGGSPPGRRPAYEQDEDVESELDSDGGESDGLSHEFGAGTSGQPVEFGATAAVADGSLAADTSGGGGLETGVKSNDPLVEFLEQRHDGDQVPASLRRDLIQVMSVGSVAAIRQVPGKKMFVESFTDQFCNMAADLASASGDGFWKAKGNVQGHAVSRDAADYRATADDLERTNNAVVQPLLRAARHMVERLQTVSEDLTAGVDARRDAARVMEQQVQFEAHQRVQSRHGLLSAVCAFTAQMKAALGPDYPAAVDEHAKAVERRLQALPPKVPDPGPVPLVLDARHLALHNVKELCGTLVDRLYSTAVDVDVTQSPSPGQQPLVAVAGTAPTSAAEAAAATAPGFTAAAAATPSSAVGAVTAATSGEGGGRGGGSSDGGLGLAHHARVGGAIPPGWLRPDNPAAAAARGIQWAPGHGPQAGPRHVCDGDGGPGGVRSRIDVKVHLPVG